MRSDRSGSRFNRRAHRLTLSLPIQGELVAQCLRVLTDCVDRSLPPCVPLCRLMWSLARLQIGEGICRRDAVT